MEAKIRKAKADLPLSIIAGVALIIGIIGYVANVSPEKAEPDRFYMANTGGPVMFAHQEHVEAVEEYCARCHHMLHSSETTPCADCHDDDYTPDMMTHDEYNELEDHSCEFCHQVDENKKAESCRKCHLSVQDAETTFVDCETCHEDDYEKEDFTHAELRSVEDHTCDECHYARSLSDAYHDQCNFCHLRQSEEKFAKEDGSLRCESCHLKY